MDRTQSFLSDPEDLLKILTDDVTARYRKPTTTSQHKTMLFRMIRGGNVEIVENALHILKESKRIQEYNWILGLDNPPVSFAGCNYPKCENIVTNTLRNSVAFLVALCFVAITPVFYIIHSAINAVTMSCRQNLMDNIDLPLIYAVLSENEDMVELFTSLGVKLTSVDKKGNNIFHYLADLSSINPDKAMRCFDMVNSLDQPSVIKEAIFEAQNDYGFSSMELLVAHGSFTYLAHMSEVEGIMKRTVLNVGPDHIHVSGTSAIGDHDIETSHNDRCLGNYTLCAYDISAHEQGDALCKQSSLLTLMSNRNFRNDSKEEAECLLGCRWMIKWCNIKISSSSFKSYLGTVFLFITFALYVLFVMENSSRVTPLPVKSEYLTHMRDFFIQRLKSENYYQDEEVLLAYERSIMITFAGSPTNNESRMAQEAVEMLCTGNETEVYSGYFLDPCKYEAYKHVSKSCTTLNKSPKTLMIRTGLIQADTKSYQSPITVLLETCLLLKILVDVLLRLFFVCQQRSSFQHGVKRGMMTLFSHRLPWSYFQAQVTIVNAIFINAFLTLDLVYSAENLDLNYGSQILVHNFESFFLIGSMITTTMGIIYSARLAPIVGLFIRTSIKLMVHMLEFSITYICIASAFATIFYFLLHNPECAAERMEGYETIVDTFYQTYLATVGQGDFPATFNAGVCITFAAYSLVSVIMLLNLIIAVMSTTADTIMNPPWKDVLKLNQDLTWALHVEAFESMVCSPFKKILGPVCCLNSNSSDKAMVIRMEKGRRKVYIEVETDL